MASLQPGDLMLQLSDHTHRGCADPKQARGTRARLHKIECQKEVTPGSLTVIRMNDDNRTVSMLESLDDHGRNWLDHSSLAEVSSEILSMEEFLKHKRAVFNKKLRSICEETRLTTATIVQMNGIDYTTVKHADADVVRAACTKTAHDLVEEVYQSAVHCFGSFSKQARFWESIETTTKARAYRKDELRHAIILYCLVETGASNRGHRQRRRNQDVTFVLGAGAIETHW